MTREPTLNEYAEALGGLHIIMAVLPYGDSERIKEVAKWYEETIVEHDYIQHDIRTTARRIATETLLLGDGYKAHDARYRLSMLVQGRIVAIRNRAIQALRDIMEEE